MALRLLGVVQADLATVSADLIVDCFPWHYFTYELVREVQNRGLAWRMPNGAPWKPATTNLTVEAVKGVCRECWRMGLMPTETWQKIDDIESVPDNRLAKGRMIGDAEQCEIDAALDDRVTCDYVSDYRRHLDLRNRAIIDVGTHWGLRNSEIRRLPLAAYNHADMTILGKGRGGGKERSVYPTEDTTTSIDAWLAVRPGPSNGALFTQIREPLRGQPLSAAAIRAICMTVAKQAKLAQFAPHDLRRTFISRGLREIDPLMMARLAGHADVKTTMRYDRRGKDEERAAALKLAGARARK